MMAHVLRVAVHPDVAAGAPRSGHGRVWRRVLAELEGRVRLDVRPSGRRLARRPDVWLADGQLRGFRHTGFWDCLDTYKDAIALNDLWEAGTAPWRVWT